MPGYENPQLFRTGCCGPLWICDRDGQHIAILRKGGRGHNDRCLVYVVLSELRSGAKLIDLGPPKNITAVYLPCQTSFVSCIADLVGLGSLRVTLGQKSLCFGSQPSTCGAQ